MCITGGETQRNRRIRCPPIHKVGNSSPKSFHPTVAYLTEAMFNKGRNRYKQSVTKECSVIPHKQHENQH
ncbi:MAG: hypothetical protein LBU34_03325 [Planctomycetaceae bacterium]|nr:hypothetical protein [Planctomycetaceae bacterium]